MRNTGASITKINDSIQFINAKNRAIRQRIQLLDLDRFSRFFKIVRYFFDGYYKSFRGWRSAIKDMARKSEY